MERLVIGNIAKPQGIRGEVKISPLTDDTARFNRLKKVYIGSVMYEVQSAKVLPGGVFVKFKGVDDRNAADLLRGKDIEIDRDDAVKLPKDRYFIVDVIGCEVFKGDEKIGKLVDVLQYGAADVYVISTSKGRAMIPAIKRILIDVDIAQKKIILDKEAFDDLAVYEE